MQNNNTDKERSLLALLNSKPKQAISEIFRLYYVYLVKTAVLYVKQTDIAENIAQDVFTDFWQRRDKLRITSSLKYYLRRATVNKSLNYIRDNNKYLIDLDQAGAIPTSDRNPLNQLEHKHLLDEVMRTVETLPIRCQLVFKLSRFEGMNYKQIAKQLDISEKTVENQISKALKTLRKVLKPSIDSGLFAFLLTFLVKDLISFIGEILFICV